MISTYLSDHKYITSTEIILILYIFSGCGYTTRHKGRDGTSIHIFTIEIRNKAVGKKLDNGNYTTPT